MVGQTNPRLANAQIQHASKKLEIGWMGYIFGDATNKPGNVAGLAMVLAFIGVAILILAPDSQAIPKRELLTLFGGIITASLGFLFGRSSS